jgi:HSP20 family molecular chaperone IbpA
VAQPQQTVPVRVYQGAGRIMAAAPLPGMEPADSSVTVSGDALTIRGARRGPLQDARDLIAAEWAVGPYRREVRLQHPADGARTNATCGNGVLVPVLPERRPGTPDAGAEIRLESVAATRGQRVGHSGHDLHPTTTLAHRRRMDEARRRAKHPHGRG